MANQYSSLMPATPEELHERRVFVMQQRVACYTFEEIAAQVRVKFNRTISAVQCAEDYRVVMKARIKELNEPTDAVRQASISRIQKAMRGIMERVDAGSLDHIEVFLKLEARLAKLQGIDAPAQSEMTVKTSSENLTREQLLEKVAHLRDRLKSAGSQHSLDEPLKTPEKSQVREIKLLDGEILPPNNAPMTVESSSLALVIRKPETPGE